MLGALAIGRTEIPGLLEGEDVLATAAALNALGASVTRGGDGRWTVDGIGVGGLAEPEDVLDLGNSGTAARLLLGMLATHPITAFVTGDASLRRRPMGRVVEPLSRFGARFVSREGGRLPLAVSGAVDPIPIVYRLPVPSAQVKSAVLLAGLNTPGATTVIEPQPTRDHTERMLRHFGAAVSTEPEEGGGRRVTVEGFPELTAAPIIVPGDPSSAAFPLVAALIVPGSEVTIEGVGINPLRTGLLECLSEMGADIALLNRREEGGEPVADIRARAGALTGADIPAERAPRMIDEYPILAVAAACARGRTVMRGLAELRVKESDRLAAIAAGLAGCGVHVAVEGDDLIVEGAGSPPAGGALIETQLDHRIAMAFLVLGLAAEEPVRIDDAAPIATSFPGFVALMTGSARDRLRRIPSPATGRVRVGAERGGKVFVVAIDGPAASGKGTLARRLAERFGLAHLDTGKLYRATALLVLDEAGDPADPVAAEAAARRVDPAAARRSAAARRGGRGGGLGGRRDPGGAPRLARAAARFRRTPSGIGARRGARRPRHRHRRLPGGGCQAVHHRQPETRAARRVKELREQGSAAIYEDVLQDLKERDARDSERRAAPLTAAPDAHIIDTTTLDADGVFERVCALVARALEEKEWQQSNYKPGRRLQRRALPRCSMNRSASSTVSKAPSSRAGSSRSRTTPC